MFGETPQEQIDRLAKFLLESVPVIDFIQGDDVADLAIQLLKWHLPVPVAGEEFWSCKIGPAPEKIFRAEGPIREAVIAMFTKLFGEDAKVTFSGWSTHLTRAERDVARLS